MINNEEKESVSLRTLDEGGAIALFDFELQKTLENVLDPNTDDKSVREVNLKLKIKPNRDRTQAEVTYQATSKLAPDMAAQTHFYLGKNKEGAVAFEHNPKQLTFDDFIEEGEQLVKDMDKVKKIDGRSM